MNHIRLKKAIDSCWNAGLWLQREHQSNGKTLIRILTGGAEKVLHEQMYVTGDSDKQAEVIEGVVARWGRKAKSVPSLKEKLKPIKVEEVTRAVWDVLKNEGAWYRK